MQNMLKMLKKAVNVIVVLIQKVLITVSLVCIYFFGFGITFLFCLIFKRRVICGALRDNSTFWNQADDYESGMNEAVRQS